MVVYRKATQADEANILDFINMVFSQNSQPHDFSRLLSKVYAHSGFSDLHYVVAEEDGHILSTVAMLPMTLCPNTDTELKLGYVGSVSVHGYHRGKGYMKQLMADMVQDAKARGLDLLALGGQRQRYQYFRFENAGAVMLFRIDSANVRHALKDVDITAFALHEIRQNETELLDTLYQMAQEKPFRCRWDYSRLWDIIHSWYGKAYAFMQDGHMVGYILTSEEGDITEYALTNIMLLEALVKVWMQNRKAFEFEVPLYDRVAVSMLRRFAESFCVQDGEMYRILNWERVLNVLFRQRSETDVLTDGRLVFAIEDEGTYVMEAQNGCAKVTRTQEEPEVCFTQTKAVEFFFSPYTALTVHKPLLKTWLPLPLYISRVDHF